MRVFVIAAYPAVRAGLVALARQQSGWRVVGEGAPATIAGMAPAEGAASATLAPPPTLLQETPDVVLADLEGTPGVESVDAWLAALRPRSGLVLLGPAELDARRGIA